MKTNPWMIVSLVLACVCGFLVGLLVSQPAKVSAEKHDWDYSISVPRPGEIYATRWDRNAEAPLPELMLLTMGGENPVLNALEVLPRPGKWSKSRLIIEDEELKRFLKEKEAERARWQAERKRMGKEEMVEEGLDMSHLVLPPRGRPWTPGEIEFFVNVIKRTEEEKQALREAYRKANEEWERNN